LKDRADGFNLATQIHGVSFKKRAPRAIKEIKGFAEKAMVRKRVSPACNPPPGHSYLLHIFRAPRMSA
jgi:hypothetical protein